MQPSISMLSFYKEPRHIFTPLLQIYGQSSVNALGGRYLSEVRCEVLYGGEGTSTMAYPSGVMV
jgi:hypothetical protein